MYVGKSSDGVKKSADHYVCKKKFRIGKKSTDHLVCKEFSLDKKSADHYVCRENFKVIKEVLITMNVEKISD